MNDQTDMNNPSAPGTRPDDDTLLPGETSTTPDAVYEKLADAQTPGFLAEFAPAEADAAGAFIEDALTAADAFASSYEYSFSANDTINAQTASSTDAGPVASSRLIVIANAVSDDKGEAK
ncbi:MAG: protein TraD [Pseudomonadota bacterium]